MPKYNKLLSALEINKFYSIISKLQNIEIIELPAFSSDKILKIIKYKESSEKYNNDVKLLNETFSTPLVFSLADRLM